MGSNTTKSTVLKTAFLPPALVTRLAEAFDFYDWDSLDDESRKQVAEKTRVLAVNGESLVPEEVIARFPKLELIADFGVGYDGIDVAAAQRRGIVVTHTPGVLTDDVADLAMGLLLATARQIVDAQRFIERGGWASESYIWTRKVSGMRLGIVGMGRIGQTIARRASGFDMKITYTDYHQIPGCAHDFVATPVELAAASDALIVCVNGGEKTRALIGRDVLRALGPDGILINISRGTVVDEAALISAIQSGALGGAGLDVFLDEPNVPAALQNRPNVVITPHMASGTHTTRKAMGDLVFDNIAAHFAGAPLPTPVKI